MTIKAIKCGKCKDYHPSIAAVRACNGSPAVMPGTEAKPMRSAVRVARREPATEKQFTFIVNLAAKKEYPVAGQTTEEAFILERLFDATTGSGKDLFKGEASDVIQYLLERPDKAKEADGANWPTDQPDAAAVPAGRYALEGSDGIVRFYKVDRPEKGKWAGYTFTKSLIGGIGHWQEQGLRKDASAGIIRDIAAVGSEVSARLFGQKAKQCGNCMSPLSNVQSRAAGYGQDCAAKHGWWYPTKREAQALLGEKDGE